MRERRGDRGNFLQAHGAMVGLIALREESERNESE